MENKNHPKISLIAQAERAREASGVLLIPRSPSGDRTSYSQKQCKGNFGCFCPPINRIKHRKYRIPNSNRKQDTNDSN